MVIGVALVVGCAAPLRGARLERARDASQCVRISEALRERSDERPPAVLSAELPDEVRRVLVTAGIDDERLADRREVFERVMVLQAEVDSTASELSCLDDQLESLHDELEDRARAFELGLTVSSIAVGALAGVAAGILELSTEDSPAPEITGIVGGIASATLGIAAFFPPAESVELVHERNLLNAIREGAAAARATFPGFVAGLLDAPRADGVRPREQLQAGWRETFEGTDPSTVELFFGRGGRYDLSMLRLREQAIEQLETEIELARQDLKLLLRYLYASPSP